MIIYNNFTFITPNKVGSHSLEKALLDLAGDNKDIIKLPYYYDNPDNILRKKLRHAIRPPLEFQNFKKAFLVRNPYERLASIIYFYSEISNKDNFIPELKNFRDIITNSIFLEEYDNLLEGEKYGANAYFSGSIKPTFVFFRTINEYFTAANPDYIIRIENLKEDFSKIGINIDRDYHEYKTESRNSLKIKDIFNTQEKIDFANNYFDCAKDAIRFGYKPIYNINDITN
jgi:hypothetical protein